MVFTQTKKMKITTTKLTASIKAVGYAVQDIGVKDLGGWTGRCHPAASHTHVVHLARPVVMCVRVDAYAPTYCRALGACW